MDINKQKALEDLGSKLRSLRERKDWSLREMAAHCNIDAASIGKMERGKLDIRYTTILQLAMVLDVRPSELLDS